MLTMSDTRQRILTEARALFLEEGAEAVTMRAVAERVGVTATALYRHFDDKDDLLQEVITAGFQEFGGYLYRALQGVSPQERLRASGEAYLRFALERPEMYRTIFMAHRPPQLCDAPAAHAERRDATFRFLTDRVRECMEAGALRRDAPEDVALTIWAHVHGLVSLYLTGGLGAPEAAFQEAYHASLARLFAGLVPPR
jgi:AcrR family transcriptional regulator